MINILVIVFMINNIGCVLFQLQASDWWKTKYTSSSSGSHLHCCFVSPVDSEFLFYTEVLFSLLLTKVTPSPCFPSSEKQASSLVTNRSKR